jgi:hypothetical protein
VTNCSVSWASIASTGEPAAIFPATVEIRLTRSASGPVDGDLIPLKRGVFAAKPSLDETMSVDDCLSWTD